MLDHRTPDHSPRRILIVTSTFPRSPHDGTPAFVLDLAQGLSHAHDVTVVAPRHKGPAHSWERIHVVHFPYFFQRLEGLADEAIMPALRRSPWRWVEVLPFMVSMTWHVIREIRKKPGAVMSAQWIIPGGFAASLASRLYGVPFVVTLHGADVHTLNGRLMQKLKLAILRDADRVLPVSGSIRGGILQLDPDLDQKISKPLPMGIYPIGSQEHARSSSEFLFVGRIAEKKGLELAIRALIKVEHAFLRVIGDGPLRPAMEDLASELGVASRVDFLGRLSRAAVLEELSRCAALVIPSLTASDGDEDGTPVVLAEALASGSPVIASKIGGLAEFLRHGHNGYLIPPGDDTALAEYMRAAMDVSIEFREVGRRARSEFEGGPLDMNTTVEGYLRVVEEIDA